MYFSFTIFPGEFSPVARPAMLTTMILVPPTFARKHSLKIVPTSYGDDTKPKNIYEWELRGMPLGGYMFDLWGRVAILCGGKGRKIEMHGSAI